MLSVAEVAEALGPWAVLWEAGLGGLGRARWGAAGQLGPRQALAPGGGRKWGYAACRPRRLSLPMRPPPPPDRRPLPRQQSSHHRIATARSLALGGPASPHLR